MANGARGLAVGARAPRRGAARITQRAVQSRDGADALDAAEIAEAMGVPLGRLLVLAGHLNEEEYETPIKESDLARLYEVGDLDTDEWEQVRDFARYVRSKRKPRPLT